MLEGRGRQPGPVWAGDGGEGAKYWLQVLTEIRVEDVCMVVCDGLKGPADVIGTVWPQAITQTCVVSCVVHLMRASFRYAARQDWDKISRALKPIYAAPITKAAEDRFLDFQEEEWGTRYPAIGSGRTPGPNSCRSSSSMPRSAGSSAPPTRSSRSTRAYTRPSARGHFPDEAAALKCVYMAVMSLNPTGAGRKRWTMRWKPALQAFDIAFDGRLSIGRR